MSIKYCNIKYMVRVVTVRIQCWTKRILESDVQRSIPLAYLNRFQYNLIYQLAPLLCYFHRPQIHEDGQSRIKTVLPPNCKTKFVLWGCDFSGYQTSLRLNTISYHHILKYRLKIICYFADRIVAFQTLTKLFY